MINQVVILLFHKKLSEYKADGTEKWDSFKHKLDRDLDELGKALKGLQLVVEVL